MTKPIDLMIVNGDVVLPHGTVRADVCVDDGRITGVVAPGQAPHATRIIDAKDLKILRDCRQQTISVRIAALDDTPAKEKVSLSKDTSSRFDGKVPLSGLGIQLADSDDGLVIADVAVNSAAADAQLSPGDKLLMVNQTPVKTVSEAQRAVAEARQKHRDAVLLQVEQNGNKAFIGVPFSGS